MSVDAIIPAYRPDEELSDIVNRLNKQTVKPENIIIYLTVENSAQAEELRGKLGQSAIVREVNKSDFSHGGTRQRGVDESSADYCLMMTQDAVPAADNLIEELLKAFDDNNTALAFARQLPKENADEIEKFSRKFNYPKTSYTRTEKDFEQYGIKTVFCSDSCCMYKRSVHMEVGGFDRTTQFNEDSIFAYNALKKGYSMRYCAEAKVYHSHRLSLKQQFIRNRNIARCQREHSDIYGNIKSEKEGIKYLKTGIRYFMKSGRPGQAAGLVINCIARYAGFFCGKHF